MESGTILGAPSSPPAQTMPQPLKKTSDVVPPPQSATSTGASAHQNVDNILCDDAVQNSANTRLGTDAEVVDVQFKGGKHVLAGSHDVFTHLLTPTAQSISTTWSSSSISWLPLHHKFPEKS